MKKIVIFILLTCMVLTLAACGKAEITAQEIYDAGQVEAMIQNHQSVYVQRAMDDVAVVENYLTKEYSYVQYPDEENAFAQFMTDSVSYVYMGGNYLRYLYVEPDGVTNDFASDHAELRALDLAADIVDETIESVSKKDGRIVVNSFLGEKILEELAEEGAISGKSEYVLDAKTKELISVFSDYVYEGEAIRLTTEITYDAEVPEMLEAFLKYENQTEELRNVTIVSNPGTEKEVSQDFRIPKGMIVGFTFADGSEDKVSFYTDAACTQAYDPYADTDSDLTVYIKWTE
jgi:hypothetical protein